MHMAVTDLSRQNILTINNTDLSGKSNFRWATLHEGDYVEILQEETKRNITHDYGLYVVTAVAPGDGIMTVNLALYQGQGDALAGQKFEVRVLDIAESDLDMAALDERYAQKSHPHDDLASKSYVDTELGKKANTHSHPYASSSHTHSGLGGSGVKAWQFDYLGVEPQLTGAVSGLLGIGGLTGTS